MDPSINIIKASDGSGNASLATVQSIRAALATTIDVNTVSGIPAYFCGSMGTPHTFTDPVTSETITVISEATAVDFRGHVDGSNLEIDEIAPGYTDAGSAVGDIVVIRPTTQWSDNVAGVFEIAHNDAGTLKTGAADRALNAPQGYLINGKIDRTVATNDITVAIKTLAGTNPSASDPVYVRIGNTIRSITAALSVTKNDGTNWFNSGSAALATQEVDYFVYLGYNATDGVTIGFSRIPYARVYGDFSATSTNDKYCAISTITNAASTDEYENVGRFNAILSATASFNWSVPGTSIVINRPIFETRTLSYTPAVTLNGGGSNGNATITGNYTIKQRQVGFWNKYVIGSTTSFAGLTSISVLFPIDASSAWGAANVYGNFSGAGNPGAAVFTLSSYNQSTTGYALVAYNTGAAYMTYAFVTAAVPGGWGTGNLWTLKGDYDIA